MKKRFRLGGRAKQVSDLLAGLHLHTVCCGAHCPNQNECFSRGTATFLILGETCTRNCRFCAIRSAEPSSPRDDEPQAVAEAAARLQLQYVVITSVTRDDLPDGGAGHFARTIRAVRERLPGARIEVLTPDFAGSDEAVGVVADARPDVFNHNVETVPRLYPLVRPQADYARSLHVLAIARKRGQEPFSWLRPPGMPATDHKKVPDPFFTKSGLMVGLGETPEEVERVLVDLREIGCDIVTIGQYLAPSAEHAPVARFVPPAEFEAWQHRAEELGFAAVASGPFVRSSYRAENLFPSLKPRTLGRDREST